MNKNLILGTIIQVIDEINFAFYFSVPLIQQIIIIIYPEALGASILDIRDMMLFVNLVAGLEVYILLLKFIFFPQYK